MAIDESATTSSRALVLGRMSRAVAIIRSQNRRLEDCVSGVSLRRSVRGATNAMTALPVAESSMAASIPPCHSCRCRFANSVFAAIAVSLHRDGLRIDREYLPPEKQSCRRILSNDPTWFSPPHRQSNLRGGQYKIPRRCRADRIDRRARFLAVRSADFQGPAAREIDRAVDVRRIGL